jgi:putative transposase
VIQRQLKLRLTFKQEYALNEWLWRLTGVHNWALRKIEQDGRDGIWYSKMEFQNLLAGHGEKIDIPSHVIQGTLRTAYDAWQCCFKKLAKKPRLKGKRNKVSSIPFPDPFRTPKNNRVTVPGLGKVKFYKQALPEGKIKNGRIIKRANGWYLSLVIDCTPNAIPITGNGEIGIDPGFKDLLTLSNGTKIEHPRELEISAKRLAQAQRGRNRKLVSRIEQKTSNQRKDRNHKLSRILVSENGLIVWSKDDHSVIAKKFGKSVASSAHYQLRQYLTYKCRTDGRRFVEVSIRNSTKTCSCCGALTGPSGWSGLAVRFWKCEACGASHDRDINAAINTLRIGRGLRHEIGREAESETVVNLGKPSI